jgi:HEAT repeat protein
MTHAVDRLLSATGIERDVFWSLLHTINALLGTNRGAVTNLSSWLRAQDYAQLGLRHYDPCVIDTILHATLGVLEDSTSVSYLVERLQDARYAAYRFSIITMLGWLGPRARAAVPVLVHYASGTGAEVEAAKRALLLIGNAEPDVLAALQQSVATADDGEFRELADLARRMGLSTTAEFGRILYAAAQSMNPDLREAVADTIRHLGASAQQSLTDLLAHLHADPEERVREAAQRAAQLMQ